MTPSQFSQAFSKMERAVDNTIARATTLAAQQSLRFFELQFNQGGYEPAKQFVPWAKRKYQVNHPLLRKTGRLAGSFQLQRQGNGFVVTNTAPYAQYVNDGTNDTSARPILYESEQLSQDLDKVFTEHLRKLFNA
jgi:phage gpG-like protein